MTVSPVESRQRTHLHLAVTGCAILLALLAAAPAAGQVQGEIGSIQLYGSVSSGHLIGGDGLYSWTSVPTQGVQSADVTLGASPTAGVGLAARLPELGLQAGVAATRTFGLSGGVAGTVRQPCPQICIPTLPDFFSSSFDGSLTFVTATVDVRTFPSIGRVQPFLTVGGGLKAYDFQRPTLPDSVSVPVPTDETMGTVGFGGGASVPVGDLEVVARVTDYVSDPPRPERGSAAVRHDLSASLGISYRLW